MIIRKTTRTVTTIVLHEDELRAAAGLQRGTKAKFYVDHPVHGRFELGKCVENGVQIEVIEVRDDE